MTTDSDSESDDSVLGLGGVDFSGVDFDADGAALTLVEKEALQLEREICFGDFRKNDNDNDKDELSDVLQLAQYLATGNYVEALKGEVAQKFLSGETTAESFSTEIQRRISTKVESVVDCLELEFLGIAALNLFLQLNYTGPSLDEGITAQSKTDPLQGINPHLPFQSQLSADTLPSALQGEEEKKESTITTSSHVHTKFHNAVLAELAVDGEWPCQVCEVPYLLLLARSILTPLAKQSTDYAAKLTGAKLWSARAAVAHGRLMQSTEPPKTLWDQVEATFQLCLDEFCGTDASGKEAATVMLEWGLAQHHFDRPGMGKKAFQQAKQYSGLTVSVTGASGVRTKFQTKNTAQMLVEAASASTNTETNTNTATSSNIKDLEQKIEREDEEELLLERVKFQDESKNEIKDLTVLDQAILLGLCLDVKNSNPTGDELTGEEMAAFLARVLDHHDDWMLYSTALLERAWLEFERTHGRERAILQIQALADQHTNRLTLTQSTKQSIEESAPVQDRLVNLHSIVYPPRWAMLNDLADRYANLGIFRSAAELYTQIEHWDAVVECYRRSGRESQAQEIVRERLALQETPRMWAALGDITNDPQYWLKAVEMSKGRFSSAYVALGAHYFDKGDLETSFGYYEKALEVRPIAPAVWFRLGAISMQLSKWDDALRSFSRVVQLEPEEHQAWANVAAVHMRKNNPAEAYPALQESLKYFRNNWRVWISKLYVCLDLKKYDEAVQACNSILYLKNSKQASDGIPPLEERCVRGIVGGTLEDWETAVKSGDQVALDSAKRSLGRTLALLNRLKASNKPEPWLFETIAFFHDQIGDGHQEVLDNLMKEYRTLQSVAGWEKDDHQVTKVCQVVGQVTELQRRQATKESLSKSKFLVRGVIQKVEKSRMDAMSSDCKVPAELDRLKKLLEELEEDLDNL